MSKTAGHVDKVKVKCQTGEQIVSKNNRTGGQRVSQTVGQVDKLQTYTRLKRTLTLLGQNIHTATKNANCNRTKQTFFFSFFPFFFFFLKNAHFSETNYCSF